MKFKQVKNFVSKNKFLVLFLLSLFLIKLYPFYYLGIPTTLLTSLTLAKIILLMLAIIILITDYNKVRKVISQNKLVFSLLVIYFLCQSLSVITTSDIFLFVKAYHNIFFFIIIFFLSFILAYKNIRNQRLINIFVVTAGLAYILGEAIFRIFYNSLLPLFKALGQKEIVDNFLFNALQGKYSLAIGTEMFLPFFLFLIYPYRSDTKIKVVFIFASITLIFLSILSNFRIRLLLIVFCLLSYLLIFVFRRSKRLVKIAKLKLAAVIFFTAALIVVGYSAISVSNSLYEFNIIDRFLLQDTLADEATLVGRSFQIQRSIEMFQSSPLTGIGLGNYQTTVDLTNLQFTGAPQYQIDATILSSSLPHNVIFQILGETGILGLTSFLLIMGWFLYCDIKFFRFNNTNDITNIYIIASWSFIVYAQLNPVDTLFTMGWFWFLRGIIEARYANTTHSILVTK